MKLSFFSVFISMLIPAACYSQTVPDSLESKVNAIFKEYNFNNKPGCAVAIISDGKTILKKGYGMANLEHHIPVTPITIFDVASVSKQFTGFAISTLIEEGKISENDDIRKYLAFVPDFGKTITIGHLLHHTSGLRDWTETLILAGWRHGDAFTFDDVIRMVEHQKELDFEPGSKYSYCNTGYNLLAAIVEKVSGKSFAEWMKENLFSELKMNASQIVDDYNVIIKNLADSYILNKNQTVNCTDLLSAYGSSSLFMSLEDMIIWSNHFNKQVDKKDPVFLRMLEPGRLNNTDTVYYGFGLSLNKGGEQKRIAHTGSWAGFRNIITHYPDEHLSIILFSNSGSFSSRNSCEQIADIVLQRKPLPATPFNDLSISPDVNVNKSLAEKYVGTYQLGPDWYISISMDSGRLMCCTNGETPCSMAARSDSTFWVNTYNNSITFVKDSSNGYLLKYNSKLANRIIPFVHDSLQLKKYIGKYYSEELNTEYTMTVTDGKLWMYHIRIGNIEMFPDPVEGSFGSIIGKFRFIKNLKSEITGLNVSGFRMKNTHFNKE